MLLAVVKCHFYLYRFQNTSNCNDKCVFTGGGPTCLKEAQLTPTCELGPTVHAGAKSRVFIKELWMVPQASCRQPLQQEESRIILLSDSSPTLSSHLPPRFYYLNSSSSSRFPYSDYLLPSSSSCAPLTSLLSSHFCPSRSSLPFTWLYFTALSFRGSSRLHGHSSTQLMCCM